MKKQIAIHPLAKMFPEITGQDFKDLCEDIKQNGLRQKITTLNGAILDGVNRHNACIATKTKPIFEEFKGKNPAAFVISQNLKRRHLSESQRAMLAAEIAKCPNSDTTITAAAKTLNVSRTSAHVAANVKKKSPKLAAKVKAGKMSLHKAEQKINPKPLPRGGLVAEAIRAKQAESQKPAALKGIDMAKVEPVDSPRIIAGITPEDFQIELDRLEKLIPADAETNPYLLIISKLAERLNCQRQRRWHQRCVR